jgi:hypothetical protein
LKQDYIRRRVRFDLKGTLEKRVQFPEPEGESIDVSAHSSESTSLNDETDLLGQYMGAYLVVNKRAIYAYHFCMCPKLDARVYRERTDAETVIATMAASGKFKPHVVQKITPDFLEAYVTNREDPYTAEQTIAQK